MYQVLSLKYRPKNFNELIGQEAVSRSLSNALDSKRLANAYLFSGLRGSGKTSSARILAKSMLCKNGPTSHPCEVCDSCKMANENAHIDIIEMDAASRRKIDDIRELIERTKTYPSISRYKVFIIDEVHMLTKEAFNAFLKTLEEPLEHIKFILATTDPLKLPATILSRTQHFRFKPISQNLVINHLANILNKENITFEDEALKIIARSGEGSLRDSITLLDQSISFTNGSVNAKEVASMLGLVDPVKIDQILNIVLKRDREGVVSILDELSSYEADSIIDQLTLNLKDKFLSKDPKFNVFMYERFFRVLSEAKTMLNMGSDNGFTMAMTLFLMIESMSLKSIDDVISEISNKEQNNILKDPKNLEKDKKDSIPEIKTTKTPYDEYLANIYDRNYELGECFKRSVKFNDFKDNILFITSFGDEVDSEFLRKSSKVIMEILRKTFNKDSKIKISKLENEQSLQNKNSKTINQSYNTNKTAIENISKDLSIEKEDNLNKNYYKTQDLEDKDLQINDDGLSNSDLDDEFNKDLESLKKFNDLKKNLSIDSLEEKNKSLLDELKSSNNFKESKEARNLKELTRLFGDPKVEEN
ncbi:DNA polymerase III subunit gamma/tau [Campylobacter ureolyticus]|uniref:DNA polymerase III subunit gamma/tau n=1 Tax=Campylobacter ureolyticus TaxID=827 RepID=A0A9Q4PS31_9BACT|nr:DNA polymerase III subunit gamma/tau [Campylobacter ureolyticus]MCZ6159592.1 DNA polymerase III subunit gamma/tau [Campylobacter ureolyticus]MCZ6163503.1 DNA polymerase III subunit gamma/tau [Campylobacter ureolyticus]MCZ6165415.1 DNA polymerase III subunit gamma/tau [Campylobacter ureolyticus]